MTVLLVEDAVLLVPESRAAETVLARETVRAVRDEGAVAAVGAHPSEVVFSPETGAVVEEFSDATSRYVHGMACRFTRRQFPAVAAFDGIEAAEALKASCAVEESVADAILGVHVLLILPDRLHAHLFKLPKMLFVCGVPSIHDLLLDLRVRVLVDRLVVYMEGLVPEIVAEEAVRTALTVDAEVAVSYIRTSVQI